MKHLKANRIMETIMSIAASFDSDAYLSILSQTGISDKKLQQVEIDLIKNKNSGMSGKNWSR